MGRIVATEFVSLDGVFEDPGGAEDFEHGGWTFDFDRGDEGNSFKGEELQQADAQLLGRITYEGFAAAWPDRTDEYGFAERMNSMPKYVVSSTLTNPTWNNTTVISDGLPDEFRRIKERHERDILIAGSGQLVRGLLEANLLDELRLMVFPVVLGSGKRLFDEMDRTRLKLASSRPVGPDGVIILTYEPVAVEAGVGASA